MSILPAWAPNVHPLIVHFPIALLFLAVFVNLLVVVFRRQRWLQRTATLIYVLGASSVVVTFITGRHAADIVTLPPLANPVLSEHAEWALRTVWFFAVLAVVHLFVQWKNLAMRLTVSVPLLLLGVGGLGLILKTAERGAELVFRYGVGVAATAVIEDTASSGQMQIQSGEFVVSENGSWYWEPKAAAVQVLFRRFTWLEGSASDLDPVTILGSDGGLLLMLRPSGKPVLFVAGQPLRSVQMDLTINMDKFKGVVMLVDHVQDALNYDFLSIEDGRMKLGRLEEGQARILDEGAVSIAGWTNIRVVGDRTHLRGYVGERLVTHGHASEFPAGPAGMRIEGDGSLLVKSIQVLSLAEKSR